jgi:hypothetical protein
MESQDIILHSNKLTLLPAMFFDRELPQSFIGDPPGSSSDTLAPATQEVLKIKAEKDIQTATESANRIWYIIYQRVIDEHNDGASSTFPDIQYLNSRYTLETEETWDGLRLLLYTEEP